MGRNLSAPAARKPLRSDGMVRPAKHARGLERKTSNDDARAIVADHHNAQRTEQSGGGSQRARMNMPPLHPLDMKNDGPERMRTWVNTMHALQSQGVPAPPIQSIMTLQTSEWLELRLQDRVEPGEAMESLGIGAIVRAVSDFIENPWGTYDPVHALRTSFNWSQMMIADVMASKTVEQAYVHHRRHIEGRVKPILRYGCTGTLLEKLVKLFV